MPDDLERFSWLATSTSAPGPATTVSHFLASPQAKQTVEQILEQTRTRHGARIYAYVLMPNHVYLLINESFALPLDRFIKSVKTGNLPPPERRPQALLAETLL